MGLRKHHRINLSGIDVVFSDRRGFGTGTIKDVSRFGIGISDIPRRLNMENDLMTLVISFKGKQFKLQAIPKWEKKSGPSLTTGVEVENTPWEWTEMIMCLEPKN